LVNLAHQLNRTALIDQAIVDGCEAGGVGIAQPSHL
jgi:hypothetical protein